MAITQSNWNNLREFNSICRGFKHMYTHTYIFISIQCLFITIYFYVFRPYPLLLTYILWHIFYQITNSLRNVSYKNCIFTFSSADFFYMKRSLTCFRVSNSDNIYFSIYISHYYLFCLEYFNNLEVSHDKSIYNVPSTRLH